MPDFDLVIRGGTVADGSGGDLQEVDVAIKGERIVAVGKGLARGKDEIDARGLLVAPGFVDIHTHYDGQVTWTDTLEPSSDHGVTTVVMGNCGVGFAPCRPADRKALITLMEGVEDLPEAVLAAGVPWGWEGFGGYMDFLGSRAYNIDIAAQVPHAPVRVYVMGERAFAREASTDADNTQMAGIVADAIRAGALGFTTSRSFNHKGSDGRETPTLVASEIELTAIARAVGECGTGVLEAILDPVDPVAEMEMFGRIARASGRPMSVSVMQRHSDPEQWRDVMSWIDRFNAEGIAFRGQVSERPVGALYGLDISFNPLARSLHYASIANLPLADRVKALSEPEFRARMLRDLAQYADTLKFDKMFVLGNPPCYEPTADRYVTAIAKTRNIPPMEALYDLLLSDGGRTIIAQPGSNLGYGNLDVCREMMLHPHTVMGLADGGAHLGILCDASQQTHMLAYWTRDRKHDRIPLAKGVSLLSRETAAAVGLNDRGQIRPGMRADMNVIDYDNLSFERPTATYDLPEGGRRLRQHSRGYVATLVAGEAIVRNDQDTGVRPGRLVRGARTSP